MGKEPKDEDDPLGFDKFAKRIDEMNGADSSKPPDLPPKATTEKTPEPEVPGEDKAVAPKVKRSSLGSPLRALSKLQRETFRPQSVIWQARDRPRPGYARDD